MIKTATESVINVSMRIPQISLYKMVTELKHPDRRAWNSSRLEPPEPRRCTGPHRSRPVTSRRPHAPGAFSACRSAGTAPAPSRCRWRGSGRAVRGEAPKHETAEKETAALNGSRRAKEWSDESGNVIEACLYFSL